MPLYYTGDIGFATDSPGDFTRVLDLGPNFMVSVTRGYHQLTHHGKVDSYIKELSIIERFHTKQFGLFLDKLTAIKEPNGKNL